jgi:uncharacterized repeat protein (TIGR04076 family)
MSDLETPMPEPSRSTSSITDVKVKIVHIKGTCPYEHKVGDEWTVDHKTPGGMCNMAYMSMYPHIRVLQRGGQYELPKGSGVIRLGCPDAWNLVVFELQAVEGTARPAPQLSPGTGDLDKL